MPITVKPASVATEGNGSAASFPSKSDVERLGKPVAIACLNGAIESFIVPRNMSRCQLAEDLCGMTEGNFSKVVNAVQGDFWALVYKLPTAIRADFFDRLSQTERVDPFLIALEQLNMALLHVLRLQSARLPERATGMAKAEPRHAEPEQRTA